MLEFCRLAKEWTGQDIGGWEVSEKLDGMRALWKPETRGLAIGEVSWANTEKDKRSHVCSGLWSRLRKPIFCPDWWDLGPLPLDVELWLGRGKFQQVMSVCKSLTPGPGWIEVKYMVFNGLGPGPYIREVQAVEQVKLPRKDWESELLKMLDRTTALGGEGLMARRPGAAWIPGRSSELLKVKPLFDSEALVVGWTPGLGKYEGMMGSLHVAWKGLTFGLSGFDDAERALGPDGEPVHFKKMDEISFKYRDISDDGVPRFATYWRHTS